MNLTLKRVSKGKQTLSYKGQRKKKKYFFLPVRHSLDTLNIHLNSQKGKKMVAQISKWLMVHGDF